MIKHPDELWTLYRGQAMWDHHYGIPPAIKADIAALDIRCVKVPIHMATRLIEAAGVQYHTNKIVYCCTLPTEDPVGVCTYDDRGYIFTFLD